MSFLGERNAIAIGVSQHAVLGSGPLLTRLSPSLLLQFAGAESLDPRVTFTRASTATYFNSSGVLTTTGFNLLTYSEQFDNAAWTKTRVTITANAIVSPDSTMDADKMVDDTQTGSHTVRNATSVTITSGTTLTASVFAKAAEGAYVIVGIGDGGGVNISRATFNLSTGAITNLITPAANVSAPTTAITSVGNGWYRCVVTATVTGVTTAQQWVFKGSNASGAATYTGDGYSGIYIWGAQLEASSTATTYIPTTSSTSGAARFDYNPTTLAPLGLLIEESRTNLILQSEDCSASPWTTASPYSVTTNTAISPDGTQNADSVILASGQTSFSANITRQTVTKAASAIQYTRSVYIKRLGATTSVRLVDFGSTTANNASVIVSLIDGSILSAATVAGTFTGASASVTSVGNDWYRVALTYTTDTATSLTVRSFPYAGTIQLIGDGSSGLLVWGAQLEAGAFATSYIPTVASQVTRAADFASMTGTNFSSWFNQAEGTMFADYRLSDPNSHSVAEISSGGSDYIRMRYSSGALAQYAVQVAGVLQASLAPAGFSTPNTQYKRAITYATNSFNQAINGLLPTAEDTSGTVPVSTRLFIGAEGATGATSFLGGTIRRIAYYPRRLSNAELEGITA